jgi:hypothetical protein
MSVPLNVQTNQMEGTPAPRVAGRELRPTVVFSTYWRFAAARQAIYDARIAGEDAPWTDDPILGGTSVHQLLPGGGPG